MAQPIPDKFRDLLEKKALAHLATLMPDGSPQSTPVWVDAHDGFVRVNSAMGRLKDRNMRRDARVALSIHDPDNPSATWRSAARSSTSPKPEPTPTSIHSPRSTWASINTLYASP